MRIRYAALACVVATLAVGCSDDEPSEVSGTRDDIKKVAAVKEVSHQEKKTKRECASKDRKGKCTRYRTVPDGWKKVVDKPGKPAVYCVELDNVNGSAKDDDVWYTVNQADYTKALFKAEDDGLKFTPIHGGCW